MEEFFSRFFISCLYKNFDFCCLCFSNSLYNQLFTVWWVILNDNFFFIFIEILLLPSIPYIYLLPLSLIIFYFWRRFCFSFSFECLKSVPVFPTVTSSPQISNTICWIVHVGCALKQFWTEARFRSFGELFLFLHLLLPFF